MQVRFYLVQHHFAFNGVNALLVNMPQAVIQVPLTADVLATLQELKNLNGKVAPISALKSPEELTTMVKDEVEAIVDDQGAHNWTVEPAVIPMNSCLVGKKWVTCSDGKPIAFAIKYKGKFLLDNPVLIQAGNQVFARLLIAIQVEA